MGVAHLLSEDPTPNNDTCNNTDKGEDFHINSYNTSYLSCFCELTNTTNRICWNYPQGEHMYSITSDNIRYMIR